MNKKTIQIAFAIVLVILSVASTFIDGNIMYNIILAVIVPSFVLTIISFIDEIIESCEINSNALSESCLEFSKEHLEEAKQQALEADGKDPSFSQKFNATLDLCKLMQRNSEGYSDAKDFFVKCRHALWVSSIIGYVFLFLSLIFSPYIVNWLSSINLNCLTLWSLTILFLSVELKPELAKKTFGLIAKHFLKKNREKDIIEEKK